MMLIAQYFIPVFLYLLGLDLPHPLPSVLACLSLVLLFLFAALVFVVLSAVILRLFSR